MIAHVDPEVAPDRSDRNRAQRRELSRGGFLGRHRIPWHRTCSINRWPECAPDPLPVIQMRAAGARWSARWSTSARVLGVTHADRPGCPCPFTPVTSPLAAVDPPWLARPVDRLRADTMASQLALNRRAVVARFLRSTVDPTRGPCPVLWHRPAPRVRMVDQVT